MLKTFEHPVIEIIQFLVAVCSINGPSMMDKLVLVSDFHYRNSMFEFLPNIRRKKS